MMVIYGTHVCICICIQTTLCINTFSNIWHSMIACDPCMLARHGVALTHGMRRDLATVKAIAGDSSFFNHTIRGAGSAHAGRSCRRGYDSGQPFLINHTIFSLQSFHFAYLLETAPVCSLSQSLFFHFLFCGLFHVFN